MAKDFALLLWYCQLVFYRPVRLDKDTDNLHNIVASNRDDLLSLFGVDSIDSVPEYNVVPVHHDRSRRDISGTKHYRLSAFNKDFNLELKPNYDVISPELEVVRKTSSQSWSKELYTPDGVFYQGHVTSHPNSHVAVREMMDDGRLLGGILTDGHMFEVRPIPDHVADKLGLETQAYHVITKRSLQNNFYRQDPVKVFLGESINAQEDHQIRTRRDTGGPPKYYIEAMLTLDKVSCDYYGKSSMDFVLAVANLVNRLYNDKSLTIDITWTVTKIKLVEKYEEALDFKKAKIDSAVKYMAVFSSWARPKNTANGEVGHWDNGVLLSRSICGTKSCDLDGVAYSGYPCSFTLGYTVNRATGLDSAFSVAHEMGHNFGLNHDSSEGCAKGYIMNAGQASGPNAFRWSSCSNKKLINTFKRVKCYDNKPPPSNITLPVIPSGHFYDANKQCELRHGKGYTVCPATKNSCVSLFCYKHTGCSSSGAPPVDGTRCGYRKWCIGGECVQIGNEVPLPIHGKWGNWSSTYSKCSRTCGGGIQYRTRKCNNPSPQHHGKPCTGSSIGEWRICNFEACPPGSSAYRETQCKSKGYPRFYTSHDGCTLWCRKGNVVTSEGNVADGTKFYVDKPHVKDICLGGKRQAVGCDNVLYSKSIYDRCMKCLGNGGSCVPVKGEYNKDYRVYGPNNPDPMFTIPIGATHFFIKENSATWNVLNMRLYPPQKNSYIFSPRTSSTMKKAAGVNIYYTMPGARLDYAESMEFVGPSTKKLVPMFLWIGRHVNVGYKYKYFKPGNGSDTTFVWKTVTYGTCSRSCAQGEMKQKVTCYRQDDQSEVSVIHCNKTTTPNNTIACNEQPCPARWDSQPWGKCSQKCARGTHKRTVTCEQQFSPTKSGYKTVSDSSCNSTTRPNDTKTCNVVDCPPVWNVGSWSACRKNGSLYTSTREVICQTTLANRTIIKNNISVCSYASKVPPSVKNCTIPEPTPTPNNETNSTTAPITTKIITIIAVRQGRSGSSASSYWPWIVVIILVIVVITVFVLFALYRRERLPCVNRCFGREPSVCYLAPKEKKESIHSAVSNGSAEVIVQSEPGLLIQK